MTAAARSLTISPAGCNSRALEYNPYIPLIYPLYTPYIPLIYPLYTPYIPLIYPLYTPDLPKGHVQGSVRQPLLRTPHVALR